LFENIVGKITHLKFFLIKYHSLVNVIDGNYN